jgi:hypothetical protein
LFSKEGRIAKNTLDLGDLTMGVVNYATIMILHKEIENQVLSESSELKTPAIHYQSICG